MLRNVRYERDPSRFFTIRIFSHSFSAVNFLTGGAELELRAAIAPANIPLSCAYEGAGG
jgi:hypothetical protein